MARPKIEIDQELIRKLSSIHCTMNEMASVAGCSVDTLERRFADTIKKGKDEGKASLRRMQWEAAQKGNITMLIWLGKQLLGQRDMVEIKDDAVPQEAPKPGAENSPYVFLENKKPNADS